MVVSTRQRGGNFKGSKHQRSKPKKQDGGFLEWLVPPLAIAKLARQKKARRRRAIQRRRMMRERMMREHNPTNYRQNDRAYRYARPRMSRNFYINVSNNSSRNNKSTNQLKPTTANQTRPWVDRRRSQVGQTGGIVADPTSLQRRINQEQLANYYGQKGDILFKPPNRQKASCMDEKKIYMNLS